MAEELGDELGGELGGFVLFVLERIVFDDVEADDVGASANVLGDGGDFAVVEAALVGHAGAGGVEAVDDVEVDADPDVLDLGGEAVDEGEEWREVAHEQVLHEEGGEVFAGDEVEFGLVEVGAADVEQVLGFDFG